MSYQVLARKWRPQNFKEMVGQEHVLRALINALESDRLHHAYLFTGTRGVGKTTIARILAKCLNCEKGVTSEPCGECASCLEIASGNFVDLIEVDAASRTKVEDTRELLDNVQYAPTRGRFKVYLIDEVHMLTGHSFNALLKTLEEPPPHVKFLFATTDPQKLPVTILSRCLQFNLKRMPVDMIAGHLDFLLKEENIPFEEPSLRLIARAADGSMRDALSLLDQSIAFSGNNLNESDVREMLGTISHEPLLALLKAVTSGDGESLLQQVEDLAGVTPDFEAATDALISLLHQLAVQQVVPKAQQDDESIEAFANVISKEEVQLFYQIALNGRRDIPLSPDPRSGFEMLLLRMMSFRPLKEGMQLEIQSASNASVGNGVQENNTEKKKPEPIAPLEPSTPQKVEEPPQLAPQKPAKPDVVDNTVPPPWEIDSAEKLIAGAGLTAVVATEGIQTKTEASVSTITASTTTEREVVVAEKNDDLNESKDQFSAQLAQPESESIQPKVGSKWHETVPQLKLSGRAAELIKHCLLESYENDKISLELDKAGEFLLADSVQTEIQTALANYYGTNIQLKLVVSESEPHSQGDGKVSETPAQRSTRLVAEAQQQAENNIESDPFVIELQNRFGAQIVPGSVSPKS